MLNWLKEKLMEWLCIGKIADVIELHQKIIDAQQELNEIDSKQKKTQIKWNKNNDKKFKVHTDMIKGQNELYHDLVKQVIMKSDLRLHEEQILKNVQAVQAIDMDFHDTGKLILLQRVGNEDRVTIINIPPESTVKDYREMVASFERMYKADLRFADVPKGVDFFVGNKKKRRY